MKVNVLKDGDNVFSVEIESADGTVVSLEEIESGKLKITKRSCASKVLTIYPRMSNVFILSTQKFNEL